MRHNAYLLRVFVLACALPAILILANSRTGWADEDIFVQGSWAGYHWQKAAAAAYTERTGTRVHILGYTNGRVPGYLNGRN